MVCLLAWTPLSSSRFSSVTFPPFSALKSQSFGMEHDGQGNTCEDDATRGSIMAPVVISTYIHYFWSKCSRDELQRYLSWVSTLLCSILSSLHSSVRLLLLVTLSFGMEHDGVGNSCKRDQLRGSIMSPVVKATYTRYFWSICSQYELHRYLQWVGLQCIVVPVCLAFGFLLIRLTSSHPTCFSSSVLSALFYF